MFFFSFLEIFFAFWFDIFCGQVFAAWGIEFPFLYCSLFYWLWRMPVRERVILLLFAASLRESITLFPFGTYVLLFFVVFFFISAFQRLFIDRNLLVTQTVAAFLIFLTIACAAPFIANFLYVIRNAPSRVLFGDAWAVGRILWAFGSAVFYSILLRLLAIRRGFVRR